MNNLEAAVDAAIDEMPDDFMIKQFLVGNRAEVKDLFIHEYDEKRTLEQERQEGREEGLQEGLQKGLQEGLQKGLQKGLQERSVEVATKMIKKGNMAASFIAEMCSLSEDTVRNLAKSLNIAIQ
jgi:flagellar biosynthesis/type III secretory pathway protein FliH